MEFFCNKLVYDSIQIEVYELIKIQVNSLIELVEIKGINYLITNDINNAQWKVIKLFKISIDLIDTVLELNDLEMMYSNVPNAINKTISLWIRILTLTLEYEHKVNFNPVLLELISVLLWNLELIKIECVFKYDNIHHSVI